MLPFSLHEAVFPQHVEDHMPLAQYFRLNPSGRESVLDKRAELVYSTYCLDVPGYLFLG